MIFDNIFKRLIFLDGFWFVHILFRPKGPQLRLVHLRVCELQPLSLMYSTRPCCLLQTITRHTCPDPDLDS